MTFTQSNLICFEQVEHVSNPAIYKDLHLTMFLHPSCYHLTTASGRCRQIVPDV
jgi:hypothetical protein